jgi:hypothetical protein
MEGVRVYLIPPSKNNHKIYTIFPEPLSKKRPFPPKKANKTPKNTPFLNCFCPKIPFPVASQTPREISCLPHLIARLSMNAIDMP